jgi:hypothetical protein
MQAPDGTLAMVVSGSPVPGAAAVGTGGLNLGQLTDSTLSTFNTGTAILSPGGAFAWGGAYKVESKAAEVLEMAGKKLGFVGMGLVFGALVTQRILPAKVW